MQIRRDERSRFGCFWHPPGALAGLGAGAFGRRGPVYVRRQAPNAALAGAGYQMFRHLNDPSALLNLALQGGSAARPLQHDGNWLPPRSEQRACRLPLGCGELAARGIILASSARCSVYQRSLRTPCHPRAEPKRAATERGPRGSAVSSQTLDPQTLSENGR